MVIIIHIHIPMIENVLIYINTASVRIIGLKNVAVKEIFILQFT